ncbi:hypothetical protein [Phenylobacterium sp.]|uniref:hypothetical protein n=1 Tax=Phenylobacterium sp. TaxID=1871053 RepID=UPI0028A0AB79|nr:hypothetical protein [Phenylobacterium sp.]
MRTGMILGLALAAVADPAHAQQAPQPPSYQQWGDAQNGGYRYSYGDPNGADYYEEEYRRQAVAPTPPPCGCGGQGGYEVPTYGYASQNYGWPGQGCCARGGGELSFGYMGSGYYGGGVGYGGGYGARYYNGGGYYYGGGHGHRSSWSSSSARASSSTSISVR